MPNAGRRGNQQIKTRMGSNLQPQKVLGKPGRNSPPISPKLPIASPCGTARMVLAGPINLISARINAHTTADPRYSLPFGFHLLNRSIN